jgi:adenine phosphoribosyltransferase
MLQRLIDTIRTVPDFPKPGIAFKDITPVLSDISLMRYAVDELAAPYRNRGITRVLGIEARGFILGAMIADTLNAGFVPIRKPGKLPFSTFTEAYDLEYGTDAVEMHTDAITAADRVLIHDDVIATGGTAVATQRLIERGRATLVGFSFLVELDDLAGRSKLGDLVQIHSLLHF